LFFFASTHIDYLSRNIESVYKFIMLRFCGVNIKIHKIKE